MRIALVGETLADVREVMIDGPSGIAAISRHGRPRYEATRRRLLWSSGAVAQAFSSEDPDSLRGPQFEAAWCDEIAKWKHADACFDMLQFGLRLGEGPRQLLTTTPKPVPLVRRLMSDPAFTVTRMPTRDNVEHLASGFMAALEARYGGSRLARQELDGELIDDRPDALWTRAAVEAARRPFGALRRIVVAVDPPATSRRSSDACGIIVAGRDDADRAVILADATLGAARPQDWAKEGGNLSEEQYERLKAELEEGYSGARRAGRPMLLEGGLDWKAMGLTPKDMDFIQAKNAASRDIALAFGVPPMILGIPGDNTYANYQEANRAFYRSTVLPLAARTAEDFSVWLGERYGETLRLVCDADQVEGLAAEREAL